MRNSVSVDSRLLARAFEVANESDPRTVVELALREFIQVRSQKRVLDLFGKIDWDTSYDYKSGRGRT